MKSIIIIAGIVLMIWYIGLQVSTYKNPSIEYYKYLAEIQ